jgi:hypothetical protein
MAALSDIQKQQRRDYLKKLRDGSLDNPNPIDYLAMLACQNGDQAVQKAAITGLSKYGDNPKAMLGLASRLLDLWGMNTISHLIRLLTKLVEHGGIILLSSTLFYDNRFIFEKVEAIKEVLSKSGDQQSLQQIEKLEHSEGLLEDPQLANEWMKILRQVNNLDIREGVIWGSQYEGVAGPQGRVFVECPYAEVSRAGKYVESRIPGLDELYSKRLSRKIDMKSS